MTRSNEFRGDVALPGLGTVRYDWERIGRLISFLGPDFDTKIAHATAVLDVKTIAEVLAIGLGDVTAETVLQQSPPLKLSVEVINRALVLAFYGAEGAPPADRDANPPPTKKPISYPKHGKRRSGRV